MKEMSTTFADFLRHRFNKIMNKILSSFHKSMLV